MVRLPDEVMINGMRLRNRVALTGSDIVPCEERRTCLAAIGRGTAMACTVNRNRPVTTRSAESFL
jgi:hypothetical protein